ncbi:hypothetical protein RJ640_015192 [Escallonia rubra]|uniref:DUF4283 domain-containing protein n=1 Tax=Escallonia rubra TaxID=112253 RepID=A0AA88UU81_9ASTE|nr:hypothetical protein RJ640_015192 [Escallonia rubra]
MELVFKDNPWNIRGTLLVLQRWQPSMAIEQVEFLSVDLWLQLHFIPLELFYRDMAGLIGSAFGELLTIDWNAVRRQRRDFFMVLARLKQDDPLIPGLFVRTNHCESHWIQARFEKVFQVCYWRGVLGNSNDTRRLPLRVVRDRREIASQLELVYGTDRGSSIDSEQDLIVQINGLRANLENESAGNFSLSDQYFSTESVCSPSSGSEDSFESHMELAGITAVTGEGEMADDDVAPSHSAYADCTTSTATSAAAAAESAVPLVQSVKTAMHVCQPALTVPLPSVENPVDKSANLGHSSMGRAFLSGLKGVHLGPLLQSLSIIIMYFVTSLVSSDVDY